MSKKTRERGLTSKNETAELDDLLERVANLLSSDRRKLAGESSLKEVQLRALEYLDHCNRFSDTPLALAEFLGLTKGTVSQTVNALVEKGLVKKNKDALDARIVHLQPTSAGRAIVATSQPTPLLHAAAAKLSPQSRERLSQSLRELLVELQHTSGNVSFGACRSCRHLKKNKSAFHCGLTDEPLLLSETSLICREHDLPEGPPQERS